jgi:hypothetical protein
MTSTCAGKTAAHVMALYKYKPLDEEMLFDPEECLSIKPGNVAGRQGKGREIMRDNVGDNER